MRRRNFLNCCLQLAVVCVVAFVAAERAAAEILPYDARVIAARAQIRSGPGENFYPTGTLARGETVEVHRQQPDGWLAIRPTKDSFSWVPGQDLKLAEGGLAKIDKDDVASRIGSKLSDKRNSVQVRLKKGEVVEIIGEESVRGETWYKIAPPAGEFRWILAANVERAAQLSTPPVELAAAPTPVAPASATTNESSASVAGSNAIEPAADAAVSGDSTGDQWRAPPLETTTAAPSAPNANAASDSPTQSQAPAQGPPAGPAVDDLARQLAEIELRLSRMAAAPRDLWNTERLERDTEQLLAKAQNVEDRAAVKATLAKIDRFGALSRQAQSLAAGSAGSGDPRTTAGQPPVTPLPGSMANTSAEASRYDAIGILRPVVSKRPGAPQFALVDQQGQVVSFVTPTPDVNLQPYLGHRVGVVGSRGFIPEFQRAHVTAGRVTPLADRMVR
jgi:uncharacterized protein YgiM (DUF1202 family)